MRHREDEGLEGLQLLISKPTGAGGYGRGAGAGTDTSAEVGAGGSAVARIVNRCRGGCRCIEEVLAQRVVVVLSGGAVWC